MINVCILMVFKSLNFILKLCQLFNKKQKFEEKENPTADWKKKNEREEPIQITYVRKDVNKFIECFLLRAASY